MVDELGKTEREQLLTILEAPEKPAKRDQLFYVLGLVACGAAVIFQMMDNCIGADVARRVDRLTLLTSGLLILAINQINSRRENMARIQKQIAAIHDLLK